MAIWIRNEEEDFITTYTVEHDGQIFILSEEEYDALTYFIPEVADGSISEEDAVRNFLRRLGVPLSENRSA